MIQMKSRTRGRRDSAINNLNLNPSTYVKPFSGVNVQANKRVLTKKTRGPPASHIKKCRAAPPTCQSGPTTNSSIHSSRTSQPSIAVFPAFCGTHSLGPTDQANPFVFDINIRLSGGQHGQSRKVMKRVLLDTGSDLNLVSATAYADLRTRIKPHKRVIQSVAGESSVIGETKLVWTFLQPSGCSDEKPAIFSEDFFVLSKRENPLFDCILGRHWIQEHRSVFLSLWL